MLAVAIPIVQMEKLRHTHTRKYSGPQVTELNHLLRSAFPTGLVLEAQGLAGGRAGQPGCGSSREGLSINLRLSAASVSLRGGPPGLWVYGWTELASLPGS